MSLPPERNSWASRSHFSRWPRRQEGDPTYYPRFNFTDAANFAVTTTEGDNFPAFMGMELQLGSLESASERLIESSLFAFSPTDVDRRSINPPTQGNGATAALAMPDDGRITVVSDTSGIGTSSGS